MQSQINDLQFGSYVLDRGARQLRRGDEVLPVTGKAFDLLAYMAANPRRPLLKTELLAAVWPDSFVEEANLSQNVFLLRKVLGGGPESPIVTLPGRGYQFAADVREVSPAGSTLPGSTIPIPSFPGAVALEGTSTRVIVQEETEEHIAPWRSPLIVSLSGIGLLLLCVAGWLGWRRWQDSVGGPPVQVVLADFDGGTGDPVLDQSLADALRMDLAQSPFVTVVSPSLVRQTMVQMLHKPDERVTADLARDLCERTGSVVYLHGAVARSGGHFLLTEDATNCTDGTEAASVKAEAKSVEELPQTLDALAVVLRRKLGESRRSLSRYSTPLFPQNTASVDALKDYSQALLLSQRGKLTEAIGLLQHAVSIDPNFAAAYLDMANYSANLGDSAAEAKYLTRAYDLRKTATEPTRLYIEARYATTITGNLYEGMRQFDVMAQLYPRNAVAAAGQLEIDRELGRHDQAIQAGLRAISINPNYVSLYYGVCSEQMHAGRLEDAKATCRLALSRHLDSELIRGPLLEIALLQHDAASLAEQDGWAREHPEASYMQFLEAERAVMEGRFADGERLLAATTDSLEQRGMRSVAAGYRQRMAIALAQLGQMDAARALVRPAEISADIPEGFVALALTGHGAEAAASARAEMTRRPQGTLWNGLWGPLTLAASELAADHPADAVKTLEPAREFDDVELEMGYLRATAMLRSANYSEGEREFRSVLAHAQVDPVSPALPLSREGLASTLAAKDHSGEASSPQRSTR